MIRTKLFRSNKTQAVRLPQSVAFPMDGEVEIVVDGDARIITPVGSAWDRWFDAADDLGEAVPDRVQPPAQERAPL